MDPRHDRVSMRLSRVDDGGAAAVRRPLLAGSDTRDRAIVAHLDDAFGDEHPSPRPSSAGWVRGDDRNTKLGAAYLNLGVGCIQDEALSGGKLRDMKLDRSRIKAKELCRTIGHHGH